MFTWQPKSITNMVDWVWIGHTRSLPHVWAGHVTRFSPMGCSKGEGLSEHVITCTYLHKSTAPAHPAWLSFAGCEDTSAMSLTTTRKWILPTTWGREGGSELGSRPYPSKSLDNNPVLANTLLQPCREPRLLTNGNCGIINMWFTYNK